MINVLPYAPEFQFQREINGTKYFQFLFNWGHTIDLGNIVLNEIRKYSLTLAINGDKFYLNIRDTQGLNYSEELTEEKFKGGWKRMLELLQKPR